MLLKTLSLLLSLTAVGGAQNTAPQVEISNGIVHATLYLPDPGHGYYRGTRFDWSGVIRSLDYKGHSFYGPWFTKTRPEVTDFLYEGPDIVAGAASAITGPVEEFTWHGTPLGYDEAKPGGTFLKLGVGVLRKPDTTAYSPYSPYSIVNGGKWSVHTKPDSVEFSQDLADPGTGYAYLYRKTVRLTAGKPELVLEHSLTNTGRRPIQTSVYDHNFLVLDHQSTGPDFTISLPFDGTMDPAVDPQLAALRGRQLVFLKPFQGQDTAFTGFRGFGPTAADYRLTIENHKLGAGMTISGDRPLSDLRLWSIRSVIALEPFIDISVQPGQTSTWTYRYTYFAQAQ